ncbi:MAG: hypothetical protein HQL42_02345 [Alphaproteobacteria bacterium]|nr:hypothetical protein [Alphaproteobacteria bacterium]
MLNALAPRRLAGLAAMATLFLFAAAINFRWGARAFSEDGDPLFHGGWLVANGWVPFVDFFTSWGSVTAVIQGGFFALFGPTWTAYLAHASVVNGIYTVLICVLFRQVGLSAPVSWLYAAAAAVTYYAPAGHPHPDKEGFVFLAAALVLQLSALHRGRHVFARYLAAALLLELAFLCKGNPAAAFPVAALVPFLFLSWPDKSKALAAALAAVGILAIAIAIALLPSNPTVFGDLFHYYFKLPFAVVQVRDSEGWGLSLTKLSDYAKFGAFPLAYAMAAAALLVATRDFPKTNRASRLAAGLGLAFLAVTLFHLGTIRQPPSVHVTLLVPAIACFHAALAAPLSNGPEASRIGRLILTIVLLGTVALNVKEYERLVVKARLIYDKPFQMGGLMAPGTAGIPELPEIAFAPIEGDPGFLERLREAARLVRESEGGVLLVGLSPMLYATGRKPPVIPAIYTNPGHSTPAHDTPEEDRMIAMFARNLSQAATRTVLVRAEKGELVRQSLERLSPDLVCRTDMEGPVWRLLLCQPPDPGDFPLAKVLFRHVSN